MPFKRPLQETPLTYCSVLLMPFIMSDRALVRGGCDSVFSGGGGSTLAAMGLQQDQCLTQVNLMTQGT